MKRTIYTCDECRKEFLPENKLITVQGYHHAMAGGLLMPESWFNHELCSHDCMVSWMRKMVELEKHEVLG